MIVSILVLFILLSYKGTTQWQIDIVKYFNNAELSINLTSILILNNETNEFEPWFIAKEVATLLGYTETAKAVRTHVDELDQRILSRSECEVLFGSTLINEND